MRTYHYFSIAGLFLLVIARSSLACSCLPPKSPSQELKKADAVFSGKVLEINRRETESGRFRLEVVIKVEKVWKGVGETTISISTNPHSAACGYSFREGSSYLIYAYGNAEQLSTSICSRTRRLEDADDDLKELGKGR